MCNPYGVIMHSIRYSYDPIGGLKQLLTDKEYFKAFLMASAYIEHHGKVRIRWFFDKYNKDYKSNWKHHTKEIDKLSLSRIIHFLFICGEADEKLYSKLQDFRSKRNDIVHNWSITSELDEHEVEVLIRHTIDCLKNLIEYRKK